MRRPARPHPQPRPPTGRPRTRRFIKWSAAILTVFFLALWLASHFWILVVDVGSRSRVSIGYGAAEFYRHNHWFVSGPHPLTLELIPDWNGLKNWDWWPEVWDFSAGKMTTNPRLPYGISVPLWIPTVLALAVTLTAWRCDVRALRRNRRGLCPRCGYDLTGLTPAPAAVICPECGAAG